MAANLMSRTVTLTPSRKLVNVNLILSESDVDVANNTSTINWRVTISKGSVSWNTSWAGWNTSIYFELWIDGSYIGKYNVPRYNYNGNNLPGSQFASGSKIIEHTSDGTKNISARIKFVDNADGVSSSSGNYYTPGDGDKTESNIELYTIPRASKIASSWSQQTGTLGTPQTINIEQYSSEFVHSIMLCCENDVLGWLRSDGTLANEEVFHNNCAVTFTPDISLAEYNTNGTELLFTIFVSTAKPTGNFNTIIGETEDSSRTINIPSSVKPTCNNLLLIEGITSIHTKNFGVFLEGKSRLEISVNANGIYYSTINKIELTINNAFYLSLNSLDALNSTLRNLGLSVGTNNVVSVRVKDTRERWSDPITATYTVVPYIEPQIETFAVTRCDASGTPKDDGTSIKVSFAGYISNVNNKNQFTFKIGYRPLEDTGPYTYQSYITNSTTVNNVDYTGVYSKILQGFSSDISYDIQVFISDSLSENTRSQDISTGFDLFHFHKSGKSIGIGKKSEASDDESMLEIALDTYYKGKELLTYTVVDTWEE